MSFLICLFRVLEAGKATVCSSQNVESDITHVFILNKFFPAQKEKCFSEAQYYPFQYVGDYLLEVSKLKNVPKITCVVTFYVRFTDSLWWSINNNGRYDMFWNLAKINQLSSTKTTHPRVEKVQGRSHQCV